MANADKCYLNIPFKEYLRALEEAVDDEGRIDKGALRNIAAQEFENYKAIERRINDPDCGADSCFPAIRLIENEGSISASSSGNIDWDNSLAIAGFTAYKSPGWTFASGHMVSPPTSGFYHVSVCLGFTAGGTTVTGDILAQLRVGTSTLDDLILAADSHELFGEDPTETFYLNMSCDTYITAAQSVWVSYVNDMDVALDPINVGSISIHGFCVLDPVTFGGSCG